MEWLTLVLSGIAAAAAVAAAWFSFVAQGHAEFVLESEWFDGQGGLGLIPWSGRVRGIAYVSLRNVTANVASDVRLSAHDCIVSSSVLGVMDGGASANLVLTDIGPEARLSVTFRPPGRGLRRTRDLELAKQRPALPHGGV